MALISGRPQAAEAGACVDGPRGAGAGGRGARILAPMVLLAVLAALSGCNRGPHHPDWVIHSSIQLIGSPPAAGYRLVFPYIVGDFYGSPDTGDFVAPVSGTPGSFTLDLNRTQKELESELGPTEFSLRFLKILPHDARLARLAPAALQRNGIEPVGAVEWLDAGTHRPVMLVYIDRPARIEGSVTRGGETIRYDIRAAKAGYVWIGETRPGAHDTLYSTVSRPRRLVLTITAKP